MSLTNYVFLIKAEGYPVEGVQLTLPNPVFSTTIFAAPTIACHVDVCARLIDEGAELIELCGGFSDEDYDAVQAAIGDTIPLGRVQFDDRNRSRLERFISGTKDGGGPTA